MSGIKPATFNEYTTERYSTYNKDYTMEHTLTLNDNQIELLYSSINSDTLNKAIAEGNIKEYEVFELMATLTKLLDK